MTQLTELDIIKDKFQRLQDDRPSAIRSTVYHGPMGLIASILGWLIFIAGVGLLLASALSYSVLNIFSGENQIENNGLVTFQVILGAILFILGFLFITIGALCRRIVHRNIYIIELENLFED
jgi:hypothetical protein